MRPFLLSRLECLTYDRFFNENEDMPSRIERLQVNVHDNIVALKNLWKITEMAKLKQMIRYQLCLELTKLEDRKNVKRVERERVIQDEDTDDDDEAADDGHSRDTNASPKRGRAYDDGRSMTSSPFKGAGSVTKTMRTYAAASETDTVGTSATYATSAQQAGGIQDLLDLNKIDMTCLPQKKKGQPAGGLSAANPQLSRMSRAGGATAPSVATRSRAGFSAVSKRTGVSGSRKSAKEIQYDEMEPEQLAAEYEMADNALRQAERDFVVAHKQEYNPKSTVGQSITAGKTQKLAPFETEIKAARNQCLMLLILMLNKTDPFEKLPKDHQFYLHYGQKNAYNRMAVLARDELDREQMNYRSAKDSLDEYATKRQRKIGNKKLIPFV